MKGRWNLLLAAAALASVLTLSGCLEGDDGAPGAPGATGDIGPAGDPGPAGADGASATIIPLESCGVCHNDGSVASAPDFHALNPIEFVSDIVMAPIVDTDDLGVTFTLERDGTATAGYDTHDRAYRTEGTVRTTITDSLTALVDNGDGSYSFTITDGNLAEGNNRYLFRVSAAGERETRVYFYTDFPASPFPAPVAVTAQACENCHGPEGIGVHGGYFQAEDGGEPCRVCHGTGTTPSLGMVAHAYHSNTWDPDEHITYPTYMNNCSVCHADADQLAAVNDMPVSPTCFTCHGTMESFAEVFETNELTFHLTLTPTPETANCASCHAVDDVAAQKLVVTDSHNGLTTERGGIIFDGVDTSVTEGALFDWEITGIVDDGVNLAISWQASYDDVGVDVCNATAAAGAPVFHGDGNGNLSMLRNYAQGDDFILGMSTSAPGQANSVNVTTTNTVCANGVATTTIPVDDVTAERGIVALQGKPRVVSVLAPTATMSVRAKTPTYEWTVGDGDAPLETRREIVDTDLCLGCHVGSLYQHGGNRVDNAGMCILCHNSASNEKNVRTATMGIDPADTYDGRTGQTFELKTMLHRIHSAGVEGQTPYVIYRGRGIYAFAPEGTVLPNWPGVGVQEVYGSTIDNDGNPGTYSTNHNFHAPTYPRSLNECSACHVPNSVNMQPDQTQAMASTQDAGGDDWADQLDDVLQGAATTACITCHTSGPAKGHAYQNSWQPQEFEEGRQTIIDAVN